MLLNQTACAAAVTTPQCNPERCRTFPRCTWAPEGEGEGEGCVNPPPPPPPQPCAEINEAVDCVWSMGRDCRWDAGSTVCTAPRPMPPLPGCAADHSCAHNGMSETPPSNHPPPRTPPDPPTRSNTAMVIRIILRTHYTVHSHGSC